MGLNKKQKKQLDVARKILASLQQLLSAARQQPDDPDEIPALERQIADVQDKIQSLQQG